MAARKPFLLRIDTALYEGLARWALDESRSLNGQIEFLLLRALAERQRPSVHAPAPAPVARAPRRVSGGPRRPRPARRRIPAPLAVPTERKVPGPRAPAAPTRTGETRTAAPPPTRRPDDIWDAAVD